MRLCILDQAAVEARLRRMAYQIYEHNFGHPRLTLVGVDTRGGWLADRLATLLREISPIEVNLVAATLTRTEEVGKVRLIPVQFSVDTEAFHGQPVVVVDDVLYGGNTLLNVVSALLPSLPQSIQTAVLIDRGHRLMPISPDFVGMELATSLQQFVGFEVDAKDTPSAWLS